MIPDPGNWGAYNAAQAEREVRPLAVRAAKVLREWQRAGIGSRIPALKREGEAARVPVVLELGCGIGREARFFAEQGWDVYAFENDPTVLPALEQLAADLPVTVHAGSLAAVSQLPECDLVFASASLPFLEPAAFRALWEQIRGALRPGGVIAMDLFGPNDSWAGGAGTFFTRTEVEQLLDGLHILDLDESERDGNSFSGPKHWHTFRVVAVRTKFSAAGIIRPARATDVKRAEDTFSDLLPDQWSGGGNRRSFVAVDEEGRVLGHCRGIDNQFHPDSRVLVFETVPEVHGTPLEFELLTQQRATSSLPLHWKLAEDDGHMRELLRDSGAAAVQLMPPWQRIVDSELRAWAQAVTDTAPPANIGPWSIVPAASVDPTVLARMDAEHYVEQHRSWSPSAPADTLMAKFASHHGPDSPDRWNEHYSRALCVGGDVVAAALVFGDPSADSEPEVSLVSNPYSSETAWWAKSRLVAELVALMADGDRFAVDSHLTMTGEYETIAAIPGLAGGDGWTAIMAIPVVDGPAIIEMDRAKYWRFLRRYPAGAVANHD